MNNATKAAVILAVVGIWITILSVAQESPKKQTEVSPEAKKLHEFKIPQSILHFCHDPAEAERRWEATKAISTADVYIRSSSEASFSLTPVLKCAVIHTIGGGSATEPMAFGVEVTDTQRKEIDEALRKNQLFIVHYNFGW